MVKNIHSKNLFIQQKKQIIHSNNLFIQNNPKLYIQSEKWIVAQGYPVGIAHVFNQCAMFTIETLPNCL